MRDAAAPAFAGPRDLANETLARLVEEGRLQAKALSEARKLAAGAETDIAATLDRLGLVSQMTWSEALARISGHDLVRLDDWPSDAALDAALPIEFQEIHGACLLALDERSATLAVETPDNPMLVKAAGLALKREIRLVVAPARDIEAALARRRAALEQEGEAYRVLTPGSEDNLDTLIELANDAPTIRLVDSLFARAIERGATDMHVEPLEREARLRLRLDGLLIEDTRIPQEAYPAVVSRIKILSGLDIGERRMPQDGRIRHRTQGRQFDVRVSTVPTVLGESIAMRLLDMQHSAGSLDGLSMPADVLATYRAGLAQRSGLIIVTGPTGSGKTTTLHALLSELNDASRKIVTVENPVEIRMPGIVQVEANPHIGLTFAAALRTFLRQDPDVIMVGEIRDVETARVAIQAALTGHVVFSTLHTNDAATAIPRLVDMGIEPYLVEAVLKVVGAQRLIRRLCPHCSEPLPRNHPHRFIAEEAAGPGSPGGKREPRQARGCAHCGMTGYLGRRAVFEALDPEAIRAVGRKDEPVSRSMLSHAMTLVLEGETTVDEVLRVLDAVPRRAA